ncbi:MAG: AmmeMemoRadiSam system radical SAM enzyme [Clostridiales Family XIII bacterium]|jgi:pyruvate formate lyase activating enzyme|nr:AmmeMemoRadiSam system radical SAM enzyme [Clostridiales Family XIII bacterium]
MREALFYEKEETDAVGRTCRKLRCILCPHACLIPEGQTGLCGARRNAAGVLHAENYGRISALALDPVEKKPLRRFHPGRQILSAGSYGCNMRCAFCQNSDISQIAPQTAGREPAAYGQTRFFSPEELLEAAASVPDNLGLAFTYNEPLTGIEYILDTAPLIREAGLKVVLVSNGLACREPLSALLPFVDAMNIDIKGFTPEFYRKLNGDLETVKRSMAQCAAACHVEATCLIIPGENDGESEMAGLSAWLASISPAIPLHVTRFFPRHKMTDKAPTPPETLYRLAEIAKERLEYVFVGNV